MRRSNQLSFKNFKWYQWILNHKNSLTKYRFNVTEPFLTTRKAEEQIQKRLVSSAVATK